MKSIKHTMLCWKVDPDECARCGVDPATLPEVALVDWPDERDHSRLWQRTSGACFTHVRKLTAEQRIAFVFSEALGMHLRDRVPMDAIHRALWELDEYRYFLPPDTPAPAGKERAGRPAEDHPLYPYTATIGGL